MHLRLSTLVLWLTPFLAAAADRKPNFLFVYTDDQRWDAMSVVQREHGERARFPWLQTPHMDRLAAEGVRFRNAFVTLPLCAPSRAVFLTGRYNHLNGIANNRTPFPETSVTHATQLRAAGYTTAYVGKWHMGQQSGQRPGFDYSASFTGQGRYYDCPIEVNGVSTPSKGWVDDVTTDYAIDFIRKNRAKPFSVVVGFKATHGPFDPPERARERFAGAQMRPVPNLGLRPPFRVTPNDPIVKTGATTNLGYFRCISAADDNLGRLLATLDELGLADDTVVVFASDNGYYLGEHSLGDKRSLYEESIRIPLLARYPRQFPRGRAVDEMVLNLDLAPTWLDLAGVPVPREMQGRSWAPLATGKRTDWRQSILVQYFLENAFPTTPTTVAVRTATAKLIKYPGHDEWTELFDLAADPYETRNLARDPAHAALLAKLNAEFERETTAVAYRVPDYADKPGEAPTKAGKKTKKK
ncbi:MAG: sulfatase [Verrucomicrobia bacterium]|nr:sulfatase [Verrucomicrobiota bacterium]